MDAAVSHTKNRKGSVDRDVPGWSALVSFLTLLSEKQEKKQRVWVLQIFFNSQRFDAQNSVIAQRKQHCLEWHKNQTICCCFIVSWSWKSGAAFYTAESSEFLVQSSCVLWPQRRLMTRFAAVWAVTAADKSWLVGESYICISWPSFFIQKRQKCQRI